MTVGIVCVWHWGIVGGAIATVIAASAAATASFTIGFFAFGLTLPFGHLIRIAPATAAMGVALNFMPQATNYFSLATHIAVGAAIYALALTALYFPNVAQAVSPSLSATQHVNLCGAPLRFSLRVLESSRHRKVQRLLVVIAIEGQRPRQAFRKRIFLRAASV